MNTKALSEKVSSRISRAPYEAAGLFPMRINVKLPSREKLVGNAQAASDDEELRKLAQKHNFGIELAQRRLGFSVRSFVCAVTVPNLSVAKKLVNSETKQLLNHVEQRQELLESSFANLNGEVKVKFLNATHKFTNADFNLTLKAAKFFIEAGQGAFQDGFPRQIPLPGFSAKWLDKKRRVSAIELLCGCELVLRDRPGQVRYRFLDKPNLPERLATAPTQILEHNVTLAIITENKDSYLALPAIEGAIAIFGNGYAASVIPSVMPWLKRGEITCVYWGDMDADGYEILSLLRQCGLECASAMMSSEHLKRYAHLATKLTAAGKPIVPSQAKEGLQLTKAEYAAYKQVCAGPVFRIEQERIPIAHFMEELKA